MGKGPSKKSVNLTRSLSLFNEKRRGLGISKGDSCLRIEEGVSRPQCQHGHALAVRACTIHKCSLSMLFAQA